MSPQAKESPPSLGKKTTATIALIAALLGGGGGVALTPHMSQPDAVSKADLKDALTPINGKLASIEAAITDLRAEAAVARYEREHRPTP